MDIISPEYLITYDPLIQEAAHEYRNIANSKQWEQTTDKEKSQYQPSLTKSYTVAIEQLVNKYLKQVDFKSRIIVNDSGSGVSFVKSNVTFHECGKKVRIQKDCKAKGNGYSGKPPKNSANEIS